MSDAQDKAELFNNYFKSVFSLCHCFWNNLKWANNTDREFSFENFVVSGENVESSGDFSYNNPFVFSDFRAPLNSIVYEPINC